MRALFMDESLDRDAFVLGVSVDGPGYYRLVSRGAPFLFVSTHEIVLQYLQSVGPAKEAETISLPFSLWKALLLLFTSINKKRIEIVCNYYQNYLVLLM